MPTSLTLSPLAPNPRWLASLQITLHQQPQLPNLERYFIARLISWKRLLNNTNKIQIHEVHPLQWVIALKETPVDTLKEEPLFVKEILHSTEGSTNREPSEEEEKTLMVNSEPDSETDAEFSGFKSEDLKRVLHQTLIKV